MSCSCKYCHAGNCIYNCNCLFFCFIRGSIKWSDKNKYYVVLSFLDLLVWNEFAIWSKTESSFSGGASSVRCRLSGHKNVKTLCQKLTQAVQGYPDSMSRQKSCENDSRNQNSWGVENFSYDAWQNLKRRARGTVLVSLLLSASGQDIWCSKCRN